MLFLAGFLLGTQPEYSQVVIEKAQENQVEPTATVANLKQIFINNGLISTIIWSGWFIVPLLGVECLPPALMVYNVGVAFGAVLSSVSLTQGIITLLSFGVIEALAFIFAMTGSFLFPKYVILKLLQKTVSIADTFRDALTCLFYSFILLMVGACIESLLINPLTAGLAVMFGIAITAVTVWLLFSKGDKLFV